MHNTQLLVLCKHEPDEEDANNEYADPGRLYTTGALHDINNVDVDMRNIPGGPWNVGIIGTDGDGGRDERGYAHEQHSNKASLECLHCEARTVAQMLDTLDGGKTEQPVASKRFVDSARGSNGTRKRLTTEA